MVHRVAQISLVCCSLLIASSAHSQDLAANANVDPRTSLKVGKTTTIRSQFRGKPVVEPHISSHPTNNNHLLVAAMIVTDPNNPYTSCRLSSFVTQNGGTSWTESAHNWWGYDPWTAILSDGQTAMSWLGTQGSFQHEFPVQFFASNDGGVNWKPAPQSAPGNYDGTKIAALRDTFYFTTVRFRSDMGADVILYRRAGKGPLQEVAKIDGEGVRLNFCEPAILSDGTVLVPASNYLKNVWVQRYNPTTQKLSAPFEVSQHPGGARGYMRLVADTNQDSSFKDRAYFVRALGRKGDREGVWLNYSTDQGQSWSADTRIDLFADSMAAKAIVPSPAVNKDGVLGVSWVDRRNDPKREKNDVYFTVSLDGGKSFQRPTRITPISVATKTPGNADVANKFPGGGHYLGITAKPDGSFQLVWSDSRSGFFELQTCNVAVTDAMGGTPEKPAAKPSR